jgi:hypothetical protein
MVSAFLQWKVRRLRTMDAREIAFRLMRDCRVRLEKLGIGLALRPPEPRPTGGRPWCSQRTPGVDASRYLDDADRVLRGIYSVFELADLDLGFPPNWNSDPKLGVVVPLRFGKTLDYRSGDHYRYTRYLIELNRHLELVRLAQAYALSGHARYAAGFKRLLVSWFEQCPYPLGPNWNNSLEHGLRLVNWAVAWHLLGGQDSVLFQGTEGQGFKRRWLDSVFQHCHFIAGHLSLHSSSNNHLIGEYLGLFVAGLTWPCWDQSEGWCASAHLGLEREVSRQVAPDGVDLEQAIGYHREVATMMVLAGLFGRANERELSQPCWLRLEAMLDHVASMMNSGGQVPMIGDGDDAPIVRFAPDSERDLYRPLLAVGAVLFSRPDFKRKAGRYDDTARWILGDEGADRFNALPNPHDAVAPRRAFPDGGYYVLGMNFDQAREVRVVADAGPHGLLPTGGHAHADALSFTLSLDGREMLIDPGTYGYQATKRWREFFRGTSAHNTVRVDELDQSVSGGSFLWMRHARSDCECFDLDARREVWQGVHDGYGRLPDPVIHRRKIDFDKQLGCIRVVDALHGRRPHRADVFWHFSERCSVTVQGQEVHALNDGVAMRLRLVSPDWAVTLVSGDDVAPQGWVSRRYGERVAAPTVVFSGRFAGSVEIVTECDIYMPADQGALR